MHTKPKSDPPSVLQTCQKSVRHQLVAKIALFFVDGRFICAGEPLSLIACQRQPSHESEFPNATQIDAKPLAVPCISINKLGELSNGIGAFRDVIRQSSKMLQLYYKGRVHLGSDTVVVMTDIGSPPQNGD
jgi:hypothetical protein